MKKEKVIVAKVKFTKDGKVYRFLVGKSIKVKDLKPNQVVLVINSKSASKVRYRRAVLQDVSLEEVTYKTRPTAYLVGIAKNQDFKLMTKDERQKFNQNTNK